MRELWVVEQRPAPARDADPWEPWRGFRTKDIARSEARYCQGCYRVVRYVPESSDG